MIENGENKCDLSYRTGCRMLQDMLAVPLAGIEVVVVAAAVMSLQ